MYSSLTSALTSNSRRLKFVLLPDMSFCTLHNALFASSLSGSSFVLKRGGLGELKWQVLFLLQYEESCAFERGVPGLSICYLNMRHTGSIKSHTMLLEFSPYTEHLWPIWHSVHVGNLWHETLFWWHSQQFHQGVWQLISKSLGKTCLVCNESSNLLGYALANCEMTMWQPYHQCNGHHTV